MQKEHCCEVLKVKETYNILAGKYSHIWWRFLQRLDFFVSPVNDWRTTPPVKYLNRLCYINYSENRHKAMLPFAILKMPSSLKRDCYYLHRREVILPYRLYICGRSVTRTKHCRNSKHKTKTKNIYWNYNGYYKIALRIHVLEYVSRKWWHLVKFNVSKIFKPFLKHRENNCW